jgi:hypothetical protein
VAHFARPIQHNDNIKTLPKIQKSGEYLKSNYCHYVDKVVII